MYNEITLISDFQVNDINDVEMYSLSFYLKYITQFISKKQKERERTQL